MVITILGAIILTGIMVRMSTVMDIHGITMEVLHLVIQNTEAMVIQDREKTILKEDVPVPVQEIIVPEQDLLQ